MGNRNSSEQSENPDGPEGGKTQLIDNIDVEIFLLGSTVTVTEYGILLPAWIINKSNSYWVTTLNST